MIRISKVCGLCFGASTAINIANKLADEGKKVFVYKEILHNENVINTLKSKGVLCIDDLSLVDKNSVVVIRAHGEGKDTYDYLEKNNIEYYDATCKNVIRIHEMIKEKYNEGYSIILIGKRNHPEVVGSNGWCDNQAFIIQDEEDISNLKDLNDNIFVICQTTFSKDRALKYSEIIKNKFKDKNVVFENTICNASKAIQLSAIEVAKSSDYMLVIGGKNSSNTKELFNVCLNYCESYLISNILDLVQFLNTHDINKETNIGITAGASTMMSEIEDYKNFIEFYIDYGKVKKLCCSEIEKYNNSFFSDDDNYLVRDSIKELVRMNSDGKFIRAYLISLAYRIFGCNDDNYISLSMAYELFQTSILIHDDIIDDAYTRRGKETIPVYYRKKYETIDEYDKNNVSNSLALCLGDYGFYLANKILLDAYSNNSNIIELLKEYNKIVLNTIKGEIIDVELPIVNRYLESDKLAEKSVMEIYELKTSWYSIIGPFRLGMILAGHNDSNYDELLNNIGIAFQIKDDILGVYGNSIKMGKSNSSDISEFKQTILYSYVKDYKKEYINDLNKYYGKKELSNDDIEYVQNIFKESGALEYANNIQNKLLDFSKNSIDEININQEYKSILKGFIVYLQNRDK